MTPCSEPPPPPVERLFPFALRSRLLLVGRETIRRSKSKLHFVLITRDISENSREEMLKTFMHYPVVQHYTAADIERTFRPQGNQSDRLQEIRPRPDHLRRTQAPPHQQARS